jgi:hypothetical protein
LNTETGRRNFPAGASLFERLAVRGLLSFAALLAACAPDLRVDHPFDGETNDGPRVSVAALDDENWSFSIDATDKNSQILVDLDERVELKAEEAFSTNAWDLSFRRFEISTNGGAGNPQGNVRVAVLSGQSYESVTQAPAEGFLQDGQERVFNAESGGWFVYDLSVHRLVPRDELIYVVETSAGAFFKLKMLGYYDDRGTPAFLSLKGAFVPSP